MPTPIDVIANVAHSSYCFEAVGSDEAKEFFPHWGQEDEMFALSGVFLSYLKLYRLLCFLHVVEDRGVGFPRLKVERSILALQDDIGFEKTIKVFEFADCLHHAVFSLMFCAIDEAAPHHNSSMGSQHIGQHVGTFCMRSSVIERSGLSFSVCFYEETTEIRYALINLISLLLPPFFDGFIERIGGFCVAESLWTAEVYREIYLNSIRSENVSYRANSIDILRCQHFGRGIDIIQHTSIDADRSVCPGIFADAFCPFLSLEIGRKEDALACISALNRAVKIVPMVEDAA